MEKFKIWLTSENSGVRLSLFRLIFGAFMCYEVVDYMNIKLIDVGLLQPGTTFPFYPFEFLQPLPSGIFKVGLILMLISAVLITIGYQTRKAALYFSIFYFYIILLERAYYNNHLYLFALLALLLVFVQSEKHYSLSSYLADEKSTKPSNSNWELFIFQFQIVLVYFYGGIAKLNSDWLIRQEPLKSARKAISDDVWYSFIKTDIGLAFFNYGGLVLDLVLSLFLFHRKLKWLALPAIISFNLMNTNVFNDIGIFPYLMLASLMIFFDRNDYYALTNWMSKIGFSSLKVENPTPFVQSPSYIPKISNFVKYTLIIYFVFQILFPLRGYTIQKNMDWTGIWQSFSWRMKTVSREVTEMQFTVIDKNTNQEIPITHNQMINNMQIDLVAKNAESVLIFAQHIRSEALKRNIADPIVKAKIKVSFNGRTPQYFVDPTVDLTKIKFSPFDTKAWLMELKD